MAVYRRPWVATGRRHSPWVGTATATTAIPSGLISFSADAPTARLTASPTSGVINVSADAAAMTFNATPASGVINVSADAVTTKFTSNPPSGLISLSAGAPTPQWLVSTSSGVISLSGDAPTTTFKSNPPSGSIALSGTGPTFTESASPTSGVINLSADAPQFTDFSVVTVTTVIPGGAGPRPAPRREPVRLAFKPERARVLAVALTPQFQIQLQPVRAHIGATAGRASTAVALRSTVAAGRMTMTATPNPTIQQELEDRLRRVLVAIES